MDLATILTWFKRGCKPTEAQFKATFQSFRHKDDPIQMEDIAGLLYALMMKSDTAHKHTLADITDYDGGDKEVINAMVAEDAEELEAFTKTVGMYYIQLDEVLLFRCDYDEDNDENVLTAVAPDGKVVYSAYDANENLHIYLYNVPNLEFQDVTDRPVDKTIYTSDLDTLIYKQLENGIYTVVCVVSNQQGNSYGDSYTLTVGDSGSVPSRVLESRDGWAQTVLVDENYQWQWHRYAYVGHNHDTAYAALNHNHDGVYQPAGSYAASDHNHDGVYLKQHQDISGKQDKTDNTLATTAKTIVGAINELLNKFANYALSNHNHDNDYAAKNHNHDGVYLTQHQDISGKQDVITDLATIRNNATMAAVRAYTLDFGTGAELIQDVNMLGAITINRIDVLNVAHLYVTYGNVSHQEIDLTQPVSLSVADGVIITWEIVRSIEDGLACVGVRCNINPSNNA